MTTGEDQHESRGGNTGPADGSAPWSAISAPATDADPLIGHPLAGHPLANALRITAGTAASHPAVIDTTGTLTYTELIASMELTARRLLATLDRQAGPAGVIGVDAAGTPVGTPTYVLCDHDHTAVVAMLAVAAAGGTHLVLDHRAPPAHRAAIVERHGRGPVVCAPAHAQEARHLAGNPEMVIVVEPHPPETSPMPDLPASLPAAIDEHQPVAVSTTSGTSGVPKAVVHTHRTVVANALRFAGTTGLGPEDRVVVSLPFAFVASGTPTFAALLAGATALVVDPTEGGAAGVVATGIRHDATVLFLTAGHLDSLRRRPILPAESVRLVVTGGDRLGADHLHTAASWFPGARVLHRYNTSETLWVTGTWINPRAHLPTGSVPIGWPVPWVGIEVTDVDHELLVTSDHLALGYLNDPGRTADRFGSRADGRRRYRTGDVVRVDAGGYLTHHGRLDTTVKVAGMLVDPVQVEQVLADCDGVNAAAVAAITDGNGITRLVGWAEAPGWTPRLIRRSLSERLPLAMVPGVIVTLDALPLTAMGKVDRGALIAGLGDDPFGLVGRGGPPEGGLEHEVVEVVGAVLGIEGVGRLDDVFALGADSLDAIEITTRLTTWSRSHQRRGRTVGVPDLINHPTPAALATWLGNQPVRARHRVRPRATSTGGDVHPRLRRVASGDPELTPVVLFSGGGGGRITGMAQLARAVGGRDAWVVLPRGFATRARPDRTIEAQAATVTDDILERWPDRPVALVGYSAGGVLAAEVARQLVGHGAGPAAVVAINTLLPSDEERRFRSGRAQRARASERRRVLGLRTTPHHRLWWLLARQRGRAAERWRRATAGVVRRSDQHQQQAFAALGRAALHRHRPLPLNGDVTLVRASVDETAHARAPHDLHWGSVVTGDLRIVTVPGTHLQLLAGPHLESTAAAVRGALA